MDKTTRKTRAIAGLAAIAAGAIAAVVPMVRADAVTTSSRIAGNDRYGTAAAVSAATFSPNVPVAYIATGADYPDALAAASPAAKAGGPVLLTQASSLPSSTASELQRLKPAKIIVLGGTSSVSASVQAGLQQYTASNTQAAVTRIAGADRYATAAALSLATFTAPPINTVYVASGEGFADALAGGPAAANAPSGGGPLLLVHAGTIPDVTKTELQRLGAQTVVVLGGTSTVNESVITALDPYSVNPVVRRSGADRYLTSVAISSAAFPTSAPKVYLATGATFADALAGGPAAGLVHGPVLLTQANCIPPAVNDEITRLNPTNLIILGGTSSVSDLVLARTVCQPPASTTSAPTPTFPGIPTIPGGGNQFCPPGGVPSSLPPGVPNPC